MRRRAKRAGVYPLVAATAGSVAAYFLADLVTAILVFVTLLFCTVAGLAVALKLIDWNSDLMNRPWGRNR
jgi:phage shock protein PspC (stress-responsive transcriptional regulator)